MLHVSYDVAENLTEYVGSSCPIKLYPAFNPFPTKLDACHVQGQLHSATVGSRKPPLAPAPPQPYAQTLLPAAAAGLAQAAGVDGADPANGSQQPERQAQETPEAQELAVYAIPMHAAWFNPNGISDKERNALPEFSSSTDTARSLQVVAVSFLLVLHKAAWARLGSCHADPWFSP